MDNIIGNRLKQLRIDHQLTMEMMVEDFNLKFGENLNTSQISRWENGKTDPGLSTGKQLAMYYNVSLDYLIGLTDTKTPARLLALATRQKAPEVPTLKLNHPRPAPPELPTTRLRSLSKGTFNGNDDDFEYEFLNNGD